MIIYPAIDLRQGKVVRLKGGDPNRQTIFNENPIHTAQTWLEGGAEWLHIVNLDGAFAEANNNENVLSQIARLGAKIQFGGGLRKPEDIERAIESGVSRVVLGTVAIENPTIVVEAVKTYGADAICIALDARDGKVATHGWQQAAEQTPTEVGKAMASAGVRHALFTDVSRDGFLDGVNHEATVQLAQETGLQVIASGGVKSLEDIQRLATSQKVAGAVIGMALYEGKFTVAEALDVVNTYGAK